MSDNLDILRTMLLTWSDGEVSQAWRLIADEGKLRKKRKTKLLKSQLAASDTVTFVSRSGIVTTGTVVRVKYKKAIVEVAGQRWDIPLSMLTKVS
tara:strand:- start:139 stop:423 length:285 start_codon:yes stop_codon:yes gene_type:complete